MDTNISVANETHDEAASSSHPNRDPLYVVIPITIIYALIFVAGVVGNVITCIVIRRNKHMHTTTNLYLFSLAVSDLLLLVSGLPQEMYSIWSKHPYVFGEVFCVLRGLAAETSTNATVLTITAFTVERYVAICRPFLSHKMSRLSRALKLIGIVWTVALCCAIPQAAQFGVTHENTKYANCMVKRIILPHSFEISTFLFFVAPMLLISVLYALIGIKLRRSNMMRRGSDCKETRKASTSLNSQDRHESIRGRNSTNLRRSTQSTQSCRHQQSAQSSRRVLKMLVAVVAAFFVCWAPFHAQRLVYIYGLTGITKPSTAVQNAFLVVTYISGILYYVSTAINPVLYHIMSRKFREAFKDSLTRCCGVNRRGTTEGQRRTPHYATLSRSQAAAGAHLESTSGSHSSTSHYRRSTNTLSSQCRQSVSSYNCNKSMAQQPQAQMNVSPMLDNSLESFSNHAPVKRLTFWQLLRCPTLDKKQQSPEHQQAGINGDEDAFSMLQGMDMDISNSSLRDVERGALEAELAIHLSELHVRDRC